MTGEGRATQAAIALGWVDEEAPDIVHPRLREVVQRWRDGPVQPVSALWLSLLDHLRICGCFDSELSCCRLALSLFPQQSILRIRLAQVLYRVGEDDEALKILGLIPPHDPCRAEALALVLKFTHGADAVLITELETLLLESGSWSQSHADLVNALIRRGSGERGAAFLENWSGRWPLTPSNLGDLGSAALRAGLYSFARQLFMPLLLGLSRAGNSILGQFEGSISPYDATVENRILLQIESAFALPDDQLAVMPQWTGDKPPKGLRVMFLSFGDRDLPNDIAWHMAQSARLAGVDLSLYLDSAVMLACDFRGHDDDVEGRIAAMADTIRRDRPHVVIMDNCHPVTYRGLNPAVMGTLKQEIGFRLVSLMRDSHPHTAGIIAAWKPICDSVVLFDPCSPFLDDDPERKLIVIPVMAMHQQVRHGVHPGYGLMFMGSTNFLGRQALLAVLHTEDVEFNAITGEARARLAPNMEAYMDLLGQARAVLNIAAHSPEDFLVTGRVWETISIGGLLVEQSNPATDRFFTPFRHYLPWRTLEDIVHLDHFIRDHPDQASRIAREARSWAIQHYGAEQCWDTILGHAIGSRE